MQKVNKSKLIETISSYLDKEEEFAISSKKLSKILNALVDVIKNELSRENEVSISGFGKIIKIQRKATKRRNPQDGSIIEVPEREVVQFKFFQSFTDSVLK